MHLRSLLGLNFDEGGHFTTVITGTTMSVSTFVKLHRYRLIQWHSLVYSSSASGNLQHRINARETSHLCSDLTSTKTFLRVSSSRTKKLVEPTSVINSSVALTMTFLRSR